MFKKISKFLVETRQELKKVNWSTRQELIEATIIVIVSTGLLTVIIWLMDISYSQSMRFLF